MILLLICNFPKADIALIASTDSSALFCQQSFRVYDHETLLNLALEMKRAGDAFQPSVIPAPAFAGVNLSPRRRGAGIQAFTGVSWTPACAGVTSPGTHHRFISFSNINNKACSATPNIIKCALYCIAFPRKILAFLALLFSFSLKFDRNDLTQYLPRRLLCII